MSEKGIGIAVIAASVAFAFLLGMLTRPPRATRDRDARVTTRDGSVPARTGASREAAASARRDGERAADPGIAREDVLAEVALGRELKDLYAAEARDEAWAPHVEDFYATEIARFLSLVLPDAEDLVVECKTSTCKLSFVVPADRAEVAFSREQAMPLGDVWQPFDEPLDDGRVRVGMYVGIGAEHRPFDRLTARYRELYQGRFAVPEDQLVTYFERDEARMREEKARMREEKAR